MVLVKATLWNVVRRFSVPDTLGLADLKAKLKEVFPELATTAPEAITLLYRDIDNDLITVSSDEELKTAEDSIGDDKTLKLLITVTEAQQSEEEEEEDLFDMMGSFFTRPMSHMFHSHPFSHSHMFSHSPFSTDPFFSSFGGFPSSWADRRRMLERHEERVRRQREYEEKMRQAHLENVKQIKEKTEAEKKKAREERRKSGGELQSKEGGLKPVIPTFPAGWHVTPYGNWEPVVYQTPFGSRQVWGPWGYTASYGPEDEEEMETEQKKEEEEAKPQEKGEEKGEEQEVKEEQTTEAKS